MPQIVPFTGNYSDLSNGEGYQFEFFCERCHNGYRSPFQRDKVEMGRGLLRAAGSLFGGKASELSNSVSQWRYDRATNSPAKDKALARAVELVTPEFRQCRGCGQWACAAVCWNTEVGQCLRCSPSAVEEVARAQAEAQREQIQERAREVDWTGDLNISRRATVTCPGCGAKVDGGRFCSACGHQFAMTVACPGCGAQQRAGAVFCADCGHRM